VVPLAGNGCASTELPIHAVSNELVFPLGFVTMAFTKVSNAIVYVHPDGSIDKYICAGVPEAVSEGPVPSVVVTCPNESVVVREKFTLPFMAPDHA
jgi:hypothetical protein